MPTVLLFALLAAVDAGAHSVPPAAVPGAEPASRRTLPPGPARYDLRRAADGGYEYQDSRFLARVAADGHVTFSDRHGKTGIRWLPFLPTPHPAGTKTLEGAVRGMLGGQNSRRAAATGQETVDSPAPRVPMPVLSSRDPNAQALGYPRVPLSLVDAAGTFDLYDEYLHLLGEAPYSAEKGRFLTLTFDQRIGMATAAQVRTRKQAAAALPQTLETIWRDPEFSVRERKRIVCLLWAETDGKTAAGQRARAEIVAFAFRQVPIGHPDAYTTAELNACRAAAGGASFSPPAATNFSPPPDVSKRR